MRRNPFLASVTFNVAQYVPPSDRGFVLVSGFGNDLSSGVFFLERWSLCASAAIDGGS